MSMSSGAIHERRWGSFPALAKLIGDKTLSANWTGPSSVSRSIFDEAVDLLSIYALVQEHEGLIEKATRIEFEGLRVAHDRRDKNEFERLSDRHQSLHANLERLTGELEFTAKLFLDAAEKIKILSQP